MQMKNYVLIMDLIFGEVEMIKFDKLFYWKINIIENVLTVNITGHI